MASGNMRLRSRQEVAEHTGQLRAKKTQPDGNGLNRSTICLLQANLQ
jgi:hypothetical protein